MGKYSAAEKFVTESRGSQNEDIIQNEEPIGKCRTYHNLTLLFS